jgi:hypothetical protein
LIICVVTGFSRNARVDFLCIKASFMFIAVSS